jgi:hypothetical protein
LAISNKLWTNDHGMAVLSRRNFFGWGAGAFLAIPSLSRATLPQRDLSGRLLDRARAALDRHHRSVLDRNVIGFIDFGAPSREPRFFLVDMFSGQSLSVLVAHGRGSDPDHSGWVERFSNEPGSEASSGGAYLTTESYWGKHGKSRRLKGLDDENSNVESRAIVIHAASYVGADIAVRTGKLGRSEGCLAVASADLDLVIDRLGHGRLIYVDKVSPTSLKSF